MNITLRKTLVMAAAATLVLLFLTSVGSCGQKSAAAEPGISVIPDTDGQIAELLLHYDPDLHEELNPVYHDLFSRLEGDVKIKVLCPTAESADVFIETYGGLATEKGRELEVINVGFPISVWARDRRIARQHADLNGTATGFVPSSYPGYEDEKMNDLRAQGILQRACLLPPTLWTGLHIEGGNVVSNRRHVFIGRNALEENNCENGPRMIKQLTKLFGRKAILMSDHAGEVPWDHVDMYLTPIDDETVLVASTALARQANQEANDVRPGFGFQDEFQELLDGVARQARKLGYKVYRVPAVVDGSGEWMMTYNNVLMEHRDGKRIVYMPTYRNPMVDHLAARMYRYLGFDVRSVDVSGVYSYGGALRCLANVTERRAPPKDSRSKLRRLVKRQKIRLYDLTDERDPIETTVDADQLMIRQRS